MANPTQFAYRTSKTIGVVEGSPLYSSLPGHERPEGNLRCCVYSPCGRYFAWASPDTVSIIDASVGHLITTLPTPNVFEIGFSPSGTYVITWQRPGKDEEGNAVKNLIVRRVIEQGAGSASDGQQQPDSDGERNVVGRFVQKSQTGWNLQYTYDERYCARVVTNEVQFYESGDLGTVWNKLRVEGVTDFAISPGENHSIAVFIPERKGQPAAVKVFNVPDFATAVSQKTFFKGDKVQLKWNKDGTSLIVLAQTEVDKSGKSYYGETTLYLMSANGGFDSRIDLDKDGPIHDVTWSPNSKEFGVVYGYMPAKTTIFNTKAIATHNFALGPRNTILFSPHGRFVLVAGFGNLAGQMDIYDMSKNYQKLCTIEASNASVCEFSPDGKHILTATTSPRLRVDNGVRIWHIGGGLMYNEDLTELYHVTWRPQDSATHSLENAFNPVPTPHASALQYLGTVKTPSKPAGAYRPPGARGQVTPIAFRREDEGGAAFVSNGSLSSGLHAATFGKARRREVPGAEVVGAEPSGPPGAVPANETAGGADESLSKAAAKNKKKRDAKKAKDAAEKAAGLTPGSADVLEGDAAGGATAHHNNRYVSPSRSPDRRDRRGQGQERNRSRGPPNADGSRQTRPRSQQRYGNSSRGDQQQQPPPRGPRNDQNLRQPAVPPGLGGQQHPPFNGPNALAPVFVPMNNGVPPATAPQQPQQTQTPSKPGRQPAAGAGPAISAPPPPDLTVTDASGAGVSVHDKKVRALLKKLRAIDDLKMRRAGGEKLEGTQIKKMGTEDEVRRELEGLGWRD